jgi:acetylornithine deacetylase/succinyl-diaminopimelate desuccinylase-like protein
MKTDSLSVSLDDIVKWTQTFVRHPSPQTDRFEYEPQVQNFITDIVVPLVTELGLPWRRDGMGNLLVEVGPESSERSLMLMGYAMTHPANRMANAYAGELVDSAEGAYVRGRGVSEQKGALAAALAAVKTASESLQLKGRLVLTVSTAGETGRHDAAISICEALGFMPKLGIIVIGTTGRVSLANKGRVDVIVTVRGNAAHSSTPWAGVNAIEGAYKVLGSVAAIDVSGSRHSGLDTATLTPTAIRSWPEATHTVQDEVRLVFDRRLLPGDDPQAAFRVIAEAADIGAPWEVTSDFGPFMFPAEISSDGALIRAINDGCARQGLPRPPTFYSHGALDAGYFCVNGCEAAMWGPGDMSQWHSEDERVSIQDLSRGASSYVGLIEECLCR